MRASPHKAPATFPPADHAGSAQLTADRPAVCLHRAHRRHADHGSHTTRAGTLGAMTPGNADATAECQRIQLCGPVPRWSIWRAPWAFLLPGRMGRAHRDLRRPPGVRRRAETGCRFHCLGTSGRRFRRSRVPRGKTRRARALTRCPPVLYWAVASGTRRPMVMFTVGINLGAPF